MKSIIRRGVFETNSSSTHCLSLVSKEEFASWERGELSYNNWTGELVPVKTTAETKLDEDEDELYTHERFFDRTDYETFEDRRTINGVEVVAFGYHGYGG